MSFGGIVYPRRCNQAQSNARKPSRVQSRFGAGPGDSGSLTGCERERADTKSGCLVRGRASPKPGSKVALLDSRVQSGRAPKGGRTQLVEQQRSCLHRCSRATTALRGRIDFEWLFQACTHFGAARRGGSAPAARSSKERSRRRRGESAKALSSREVVAGREARNHGVHRDRFVLKRATVKTPAPSTSPCRANGERTCPKGPCLGVTQDAEPTRRCTSAPLRLLARRRPRRDGPR